MNQPWSHSDVSQLAYLMQFQIDGLLSYNEYPAAVIPGKEDVTVTHAQWPNLNWVLDIFK